MDARMRIEIEIQAVDNMIADIYRAKVLNEMSVEDAKLPTGNPQVDKNLKAIAEVSARTILQQERMLASRNKKLLELEAEKAALTEE